MNRPPFTGNTYSGMHVWLSKIADPGVCHCGNTGQQWAHTNTCTDTRWGTASGSGTREMAWCQHASHYVRMCRSCHRSTDANRRPKTRPPHSPTTRAKIAAAVSRARKSAGL